MAKAVKKNEALPVNESLKADEVKDEIISDDSNEIKETTVEIPQTDEPPKVELIKEVTTDVVQEDFPIEIKILNFINSRDADEIKMNDFLKTVFGGSYGNQPPPYLSQNANRLLRATLSGMVEKGDIFIIGNAHLELGNFYYSGNDPETKYHNLLTTSIVAKKVNKN